MGRNYDGSKVHAPQRGSTSASTVTTASRWAAAPSVEGQKTERNRKKSMMRPGAEGAAELHGPGEPDHEGRGDGGVRAGVQLPGVGGRGEPGHRRGGGDAGGERQAATGADAGQGEGDDGEVSREGECRFGVLQRRRGAGGDRARDESLPGDEAMEARGEGGRSEG